MHSPIKSILHTFKYFYNRSLFKNFDLTAVLVYYGLIFWSLFVWFESAKFYLEPIIY